MLIKSADKKFLLANEDGLAKRMSLFVLVLAVWWLSEHYLRPLCGNTIQEIRNYFGNGPFVQNVFSQSLPVDIICFILLSVFCKAGKIPWPQVRGSVLKIAKEGSTWGLLICLPTIPLALYLGYKLGFAPKWHGILGNIISNSYEELTYRVFLFSVAAYAFRNIWIGVFISALLFTFVHSQYPVSMQIIVGLASMFFSIAYIKSETILAALWAHELSDMILDSILLQ
jgi:hypothetical protein